MSTDSASSNNHPSARLKKSMSELLGLARGLLADEELTDSEITFLQKWLENHYSISSSFPGNVIHNRINEVLEDGIVTEEERQHLVETLNTLIEGRLEELTEQIDLSELWFDEAGLIDFSETQFCLTGDFVYGPRDVCKTAIEQRGGLVSSTVRSKPQFLVVGGLGVEEWRVGGLGVEIEAALQMKKQGEPLKIIPEDAWVDQLQ
jgi:hypothetical protein